MYAKKDEARFTIKFNPLNPRHKEAMRVLNEAGRSKASLIADALCMFLHCGSRACGDISNGRNSKCKVTRVTYEGVEVDGMALLPTGSIAVSDFSIEKAFDEVSFWKNADDSVETFFG